jgi:2-oxoisovalerate dehydrogenase E1 component
VENAPDVRVKRIAAHDSFIPIGRAATITLPSRDSIVAAALEAARSPEKVGG